MLLVITIPSYRYKTLDTLPCLLVIPVHVYFFDTFVVLSIRKAGEKRVAERERERVVKIVIGVLATVSPLHPSKTIVQVKEQWIVGKLFIFSSKETDLLFSQEANGHSVSSSVCRSTITWPPIIRGCGLQTLDYTEKKTMDNTDPWSKCCPCTNSSFGFTFNTLPPFDLEKKNCV